MKIVAAADLHLSPKSMSRLTQMAEQFARSDADVLIIAGDLTTGPVAQHGEILTALSAFPGLKLFVPGTTTCGRTQLGRTPGRVTRPNWRRRSPPPGSTTSTTVRWSMRAGGLWGAWAGTTTLCAS